MTSSQEDSEWDKSTLEIQSADSDELFDSRPNRWRGPPQSWRTLTEDDRLTYNALERLRNQDLSVHLYNAFALKQRPRLLQNHHSPAGDKEDVDAETGQPVPTRQWVPPKAWTAWPLRSYLLPPDDFMKQTNDADEAFTFRRIEREYPSKKLEEVLSATIMGFAKERFRRRELDKALPEAGPPIKREPLSSDIEAVSGTEDSEDEQGTDSDEPPDTRSNAATNATPYGLLRPTIATDDDMSYELIQPSTRSILQMLDQALTILHNTRMTSAQNLLDTAVSSSSEDEDFYNEATPTRKSRSRPRSRARSTLSSDRGPSRRPSEMSTDGGMVTPARKKSNRGRKPKIIPREGESEREFLIRKAKLQKKKRPIFSDDELEGAETAAESTEPPERRGRQGRPRRHEGRTSAAANSEYWQQRRLERLNLRDWSDVMGAAALAGFSSKVIARATQRCANLFGQGMEMHTINEGRGPSNTSGMETKRYVPGDPVPSSSSESDDEDDNSVLIRQARSISRHSSKAPSRAVSIETSGDESQEWQSPRKRQKRSAARGTAIVQHYCPYSGCERAVTGFDRLYNLKRHIKLVHHDQEFADAEVEEAKDDENSNGGVYLDGFLEPIRVHKGWRGEDTRNRTQKFL